MVAAELTDLWQQHAEQIGEPTSSATSTGGVLSQRFAEGVMYADEQGRSGYLTGALRVAYDAAGGPAKLGIPLEVATCPEKSACFQHLGKGLALWTKAGGARVVPAAETLRLTGAPNFRDFAGEGDGLALPGGGHLRRGVVFRSGRLNELDASDRLALRALGVTVLLDLRTTSTAAKVPDPKIPGIRYRLVNLFGVNTTPSRPAHTVAGAAEQMRDMNRDFVTSRLQRTRLRTLLELVATSDGPVLIHCTEGKDRTGWASAMLQFIAGADEAEITSEYLKSNEYRRSQIESNYQRTLKAKGKRAASIDRRFATLEAGYLKAGIAEAERRYGSVSRYLTQGVGVSAETITKLRQKLQAG